MKPAPVVDHGVFGRADSSKGTSGNQKAFIRSGIRYDYLMADPDKRFLQELCQYHISGTLKVAPEHMAPET